jgi:CBS domain-containing protein
VEKALRLLDSFVANGNFIIMKVSEIMSHTAPRIPINATIGKAAEEISTNQCSDLVVMDDDNNFIGVLSEGNLIRNILPELSKVMTEGGTLSSSYDLFMDAGKAHTDKSFEHLVLRDPITIHPHDDVLKAVGPVVTKQIRRLPAVKNGKLVGSVSRADVCRKVMSG